MAPVLSSPPELRPESEHRFLRREATTMALYVSIVLLAAMAALPAGNEEGGSVDGPTGIALFAKHRGEIVAAIVDITMPEMNGVDVLRELRKLSADVPLLSMSGYSETSLNAAATELHLAGFVEKPFRLGDLVTAVQSALSRVSD